MAKKSGVMCHYCLCPATKTLVWRKDKQGKPARIHLPWCGCSLMAALRQRYPNPYPVVENIDYHVVIGELPVRGSKGKDRADY